MLPRLVLRQQRFVVAGLLATFSDVDGDIGYAVGHCAVYSPCPMWQVIGTTPQRPSKLKRLYLRDFGLFGRRMVSALLVIIVGV